MQETIRCVHCNHENPASQIYCLHCGRFLDKSGRAGKKRTIWSMGGVQASSPEADEYVVICPQCGQMHSVKDGVLPLSCNDCGYLFQIGIDRIVKKEEATGQRTVAKEPENPEIRESEEIAPEKRDRKKSPPAAETQMRLIVRNLPGHLPETVHPMGDVLGSRGTVLRGLKIGPQIKIFRAPTGWYIDVLSGEAMVDGNFINPQIERRLENGNILMADGYLIFVEIV